MKDFEIVVATSNDHKMQEYKKMFKDYPSIKLTSMKEENINIEIIEDGKTFADNSLIKANAVSKHTKKYVLADDSGLEVLALEGFPGIYSARFMEGHPYSEKWAAIIDMLKTKDNRDAQFRCCITLKSPDNKVYQVEGIAPGYIVKESKGINGFGYDPIFYSNELNKTFGEASEEEKNAISHRGKAFKKLLEVMENIK